ncbi:MAG: MFS transporter [Thermodesulfobacteriota bacterium]
MTTYRKFIIVSLCYFAEGLPFGIIKDYLPVYFRFNGMSVEQIGYLSALSLPYALKFLWAPAVDFLGTRRRWIASAQFFMAACVIMMLWLDPKHPDMWLWGTLAALAVLSATQDIAIDAYSIELLNLSEIGLANGIRLAAYRVALVVSGSLFVALGGRIGWDIVYIVSAAVLVVLGTISWRLPPVEVTRKAVSPASVVGPLRDILQSYGPTLSAWLAWLSVIEPVRDILRRPGLIQVAAFIVLYKAGDMAMGPMVRPFWVDWGLSTDDIGLAGTTGVVASVLGGLTGGIIITRFGIFHALWFLGLWQAGGNLLYAWVAAAPPSGAWGVYLAQAADSFFGGAGTAAFLAFLMSICKKEYSATQYALLSSLFQMPNVLLGVASGELVSELGYSAFFVLTFFMGLPALGLVFHARRWIRPNNGVH